MWTFLHARFQTTGLCIGNMKGVASSCHIYESNLWKNLVNSRKKIQGGKMLQSYGVSIL